MVRNKAAPLKQTIPSLFSNAVDQAMNTTLPNVKKESNERPYPRHFEGGPTARNAPQLGSGGGAPSSSFSRFGSRARRDEPMNSLPQTNRSSDSRSTLSSSDIHPARIPRLPIRSSQHRSGTTNEDDAERMKEDDMNFRELSRNGVRFSPPNVSHPPPQPSFRLRKSLGLPQPTSHQVGPTSSLRPRQTGFRAFRTSPVTKVPNTSASRIFNSVLHRERTSADQSFDSLVRNVLHHRMFPLIFKGVYETSVGLAPLIKNRRCEDGIRRTIHESDAIEVRARREGVTAATRNIEAIDMFFAVMNAAFNALQSADQPPIPAPLHAMITACERVSEESRTANSDASSNPQHWETQNNNGNNNNVVRPKLSDEARQILELWFNEHFENPYPTDAEKRELARQCGLQLNQVSRYRNTLSIGANRQTRRSTTFSGTSECG